MVKIASMTNSYLLKGFKDYSFEDAEIREKMIDLIKSVYASFGFSPLQTPVIEKKSVLTGKYGESAENLMYLFKDNGGRDVGLRYDLTIPSMRFLADNLNKTVFLPYKRYQIQEVFRAEKPQRGRLRQFIQADIDIYGSSSVVSTAEIILVIDTVLQKLKIPDYVFKINSRKLVSDYLKDLGFDSSEKINNVLRIIDKLDKKSESEVVEELATVVGGLADKIISGFKNLEMTERLSEIINLAVSLGVDKSRLEFSSFLVRGLDYYTDEVFEVVLKDSSLGSVAGGGRYDNLFSQFSNQSIQAVGGSLGFERLFELVRENNVFLRSKKIFIPLFSKEMFAKGLSQVVGSLTQRGYIVFVYPDVVEIGKQLRYANRNNFDYTIFYGEQEAEQNIVEIKNMTTGQQSSVKLSDLLDYKF
ncbi:MAG: histidine--tRNA ligase [Patescibacteria group bacterium]|nr:MAG: histidine--tRNA ligase [Patescibacteria group bacterium]